MCCLCGGLPPAGVPCPWKIWGADARPPPTASCGVLSLRRPVPAAPCPCPCPGSPAWGRTAHPRVPCTARAASCSRPQTHFPDTHITRLGKHSGVNNAVILFMFFVLRACQKEGVDAEGRWGGEAPSGETVLGLREPCRWTWSWVPFATEHRALSLRPSSGVCRPSEVQTGSTVPRAAQSGPHGGCCPVGL